MASTVTAVATMGVVCALLTGTVLTAHAAAASQSAAGAADTAALAAADALAGFVSSDPCVVAGDLAERNGTHLDSCVLQGRTATVTVSVPVLALSARATARAGTPAPIGPDGTAGEHENGRLPPHALSALDWTPSLRLRADAAAAWTALNAEYRAETGSDLPLTDAYRDLAGQQEQRHEWCDRGACRFAAVPGESNHGWGTAVDVGIGRTDWESPVYRWLVAHAARFGWAHPAWARPDGSTPEAWHWEYTP